MVGRSSNHCSMYINILLALLWQAVELNCIENYDSEYVTVQTDAVK